MKWIAGVIATAAVTLSGCGLGGSAAPIESADEGVVAAAGISGVEAQFTNTNSSTTSELRVQPLGVVDLEKVVTPGQTASLRLQDQGRTPVPYVVVGPTAAGEASFTLGFANPTPGCPNVTVDGWKNPLCRVGDTVSLTARATDGSSASVDVRRLENADGRSRFAVDVNWSP